MPDNPTCRILFITQHEEELSPFYSTIEKLGCSFAVSPLENVENELIGTTLILCSFILLSDPRYHEKTKDVISLSEKRKVTFIFYSISPAGLPSASSHPVISLKNRTLFLDYVRIKLLENGNFGVNENFTYTLLKKDVERENAQRKLESLVKNLKQLPGRLNEKALFLSVKGNVINCSKGFLQLPVAKEKPLRAKLIEGLHPEDYFKIKHTIKEFVRYRKKNETFWVRHKMGSTDFHYFRVNMSNFFISEELNFALLTFEGNQPAHEPSTSNTRSWFKSLMENVAESDFGNDPFGHDSSLLNTLSLFPKIFDIKRLVILSYKSNSYQLTNISEWCNSPELSTTHNQLEKTKKFVSSSLLEMLGQLQYKEININNYKEGLSISELQDFCDCLNLKSFIVFPIGTKASHKNYILFDTGSLSSNSPFSLIDEEEYRNLSNFATSSTFDFLNFLPIPISVKNQDHNWIAANEAMLNFLGKRREDVIGHTDYELFTDDEANVFWETDELVLEEKINFQNEEYIYAANGHQRIVVTNKSPFLTPNGECFIVSTMKDVTKLKEIEKDLRERTEKLQKSERKLKNINSTKDRFFSIIAHDLKNPFNTLVGFTSILAEDLEHFDKSELEEFIKIISDAAQHGYKLLENLLDWARTQTGKFNFEPITINIQFLIDECISLLRGHAERKNIKLESELHEALYAFADANMIELVIRNLISNAIKYTKFGGKVVVHAADFDDFIEISVTDNGVGIKSEDLGKLFRIDIEFSKTGTDAETGTGLGLILCKEFVEKNGGHIYAESKFGEGSRFTFKIPKTQIIIE